MADYPDEVKQLLEAAGVSIENDTWTTKNGALIIRHAALERIAKHLDIQFDDPIALHATDLSVALQVRGYFHAQAAGEWSIGEAFWAPFGKDPRANTSFQFPWAVAEKRGKDRVILKLSGLQQYFYSDAEADEFTQGDNGGLKRMSSAAMKRGAGSRIWGMFVAEIRTCQDPRDVRLVADEWGEVFQTWPKAYVAAAENEMDLMIESLTKGGRML